MKSKIDWKSKLTSRKFWCAVIGLVTSIGFAIGASEGSITQVVSVITATASVIAYIIGEGITDANRGGKDNGSSDQTTDS